MYKNGKMCIRKRKNVYKNGKMCIRKGYTVHTTPYRPSLYVYINYSILFLFLIFLFLKNAYPTHYSFNPLTVISIIISS